MGKNNKSNKNREKKEKKPSARQLAKASGPSHEMYWVYFGQKHLVRHSPACLEEAVSAHLVEIGSRMARPWQPLDGIRYEAYTDLGTFDPRKKHGALWISQFPGQAGSLSIRYICICMDQNVDMVPDIWEIKERVEEHPWCGRNSVGVTFTWADGRKTTGEGAHGDHESEVNVVFMTPLGDTLEIGVTKHGDSRSEKIKRGVLKPARDDGMRHVWMRCNGSPPSGNQSHMIANMLTHVTGFQPCFLHPSPGGNYGPGMPVATSPVVTIPTHMVPAPTPTVRAPPVPRKIS